MSVSSDQVERWRIILEEASKEASWLAHVVKTDATRTDVVTEMRSLLKEYLQGSMTVEQFRNGFQKKTGSGWKTFGLGGFSGAMFLNQMVKHVPDKETLNVHLRRALITPSEVADARTGMHGLLQFLQGIVESRQVGKQSLQFASVPFLLSAWWHAQSPEQWPIYYIRTRQTLEEAGIFIPGPDLLDNYMRFRDSYISLAKALGLSIWHLEYLIVWSRDNSGAKIGGTDDGPEPQGVTGSGDESTPSETGSAGTAEEGQDQQTLVSHTHIQWMLARLGRSMGCQVWIAENDRKKSYKGETLGSLSVKSLPSLGLDANSQKIIQLIDVVWLKGTNQVAAAFEVEHTTAIYSGLLRMSDLLVLSPNLNFPLYIVAPEERMGDVRKQLRRPTFQSLELHKRCGFFSDERLLQEFDHIIKWANSPSAIEKLSEKVPDVGG